MKRLSDVNGFLRLTGWITIVGVLVALFLGHARQWPWVAAMVVVVAVLVPWQPWTRRLSLPWFVTLLAWEGVLVLVASLVSSRPGTVMILYFVLLPACARLPRAFSLLFYFLFPFLAMLPTILTADPGTGWDVLATVVPGFIAIVVFTEGFRVLRATIEDNRKLIDELVAAQAQLHPEHVVSAGVTLSRRDRDVLALIAKGFSNKEIAERLFLAEGTVKNRVSALLEKIGVRDRTQAALRARDLGIL